MTVREAREVAREWMAEEARAEPAFRGAYTAGSTNWLEDDADLPAASDLDIMVVLADGIAAGARRKFLYRGALLEVTYLQEAQLQSPGRILSDYHLAPSFRTAKVIIDPLGFLVPVHAAVTREYAQARWVRRRCAHARDKLLGNLRSIDYGAPLYDQMIACLFTAGILTHVLLAAGLKNPTVRARYVAVRELLAGYGRLDFQESLLELLGAARLGKDRAMRHLAPLPSVFDAAVKTIRSPFPFAPDISESARHAEIDGMREMIERGHYREAMFWIAVTHSRCRKVLSSDAPADITHGFEESYLEMAGDLGLSTEAGVRERCAEIERALSTVCSLAEEIIATSREIEND